MKLATLNTFRKDINGLRAYAVLAVLFFHFDLFNLNAGFIGVDLFFVISGYLMTFIIITGIEDNKFILSKFYLSRFRRILPALVVVVFSVFLFGWFFFATPFFQKFNKEALSAIFFISNIVYGLEGSYFSQPFGKWLLHTWTLGVEMQFYLLYPLYLLFVWKIFKHTYIRITLFVFLLLLSFILCLIVSSWKPTVSFYVLPTRAWEFLSGGLAFFMSRYKSPSLFVGKLLNIFGFLVFLVSLYIINSSTLWPSYWTLLPIISAVLIVYSAQQSSLFTNGFVF